MCGFNVDINNEVEWGGTEQMLARKRSAERSEQEEERWHDD